MRRVSVLLIVTVLLSGCSIRSLVRQSDERYLQPGALDVPLTGAYSIYSFKFVGRYRVTYEWIRTSGCDLLGLAQPAAPAPPGKTLYLVPDIYEEGGKTWQRGITSSLLWDLDPWLTSVKYVSRAKGEEGQILEVGMKLLCQESWWTSSHYLWIRLRRASVDDVQAEVTHGTTGVPIHWTRRMANGREWRVMEVPLEQLRPRRPTGTGGPYQTWITPLADTGYSIAFTLGASKESLQYPRVHAAMLATLEHMVNALKVEPLPP